MRSFGTTGGLEKPARRKDVLINCSASGRADSPEPASSLGRPDKPPTSGRADSPEPASSLGRPDKPPTSGRADLNRRSSAPKADALAPRLRPVRSGATLDRKRRQCQYNQAVDSCQLSFIIHGFPYTKFKDPPHFPPCKEYICRSQPTRSGTLP